MTNTMRSSVKSALTAFLLLVGLPAAALDLELPISAQLSVATSDPLSSYRLPVGKWTEETGVPVKVYEGAIERQAWRLAGNSATTLQMMDPLRDDLTDAGYEIVFQCANQGCGGFDFRFDIEVLPAPSMHVNLIDYRFLSAEHPTEGAISILTSRNQSAGFIQIIRAGGTQKQSVNVETTALPAEVATGDIIGSLETLGHVVLSDMRFKAGSSELADQVPSLDQLAAYLKARPDRVIVFVGHTDATGSLAANQALSLRRATSAVDYLQDRHGITSAQISADGVGYLSPIATNLTEEGRIKNRRVEAVLISTE